MPRPQSRGVGTTHRLRAVPPASTPLVLEEVYRAHVDFVVKITRQLGVPEPQVEDVVHDVFLVVHRRLGDYDGRAPLRSWLYGIARRVAMHHRRGHTRSRAREKHAPVPAPAPNAEDDLQRRDAANAVRTCLAQLDEEQRLVFVLADIEGLSAPEIAKAHRIKLNTVYSRLRLARQKFERALARVLSSEGSGMRPR